jgi:hypothetical protein
MRNWGWMMASLMLLLLAGCGDGDVTGKAEPTKAYSGCDFQYFPQTYSVCSTCSGSWCVGTVSYYYDCSDDSGCHHHTDQWTEFYYDNFENGVDLGFDRQEDSAVQSSDWTEWWRPECQ